MTATFVTATGTGIGKTFITAGLIRYFRQGGRTLEAFKPVVSGFDAAASDLIENDPDYAQLPLRNAKLFTRAAGLKEAVSPIVPLMIGDVDAALRASRLLEEAGFLVVAIRPPTVPAGTARLRFTFSAAHRRADIERLADIVRTRILVPA